MNTVRNNGGKVRSRAPGRRGAALVERTRELEERQIAEADSTRNLALLSATIEATADGLLVVDLEGRIVLFNQRFAQIWGMPAELLASRDNDRALQFALRLLEEPQGFLDRVREILSRPEEESFDVLRFTDGRVIERRSVPQRIGNKVVGRVASFRDVTAQHATEKTVSKLAHALGSIRDGVLMTDREHRITYVNKGLLEMYGFAESELLGQNVSILRGGAAVQSVEEIAADAIADGWRGEVTNCRKNGEPFPIYLTSSAIRSADGRIEGFITISKDISDRKRTEMRLQTSEEFNRRILESLPGGVMHIRMDGSIRLANAEAQRLLGLKLDEARHAFVADGFGFGADGALRAFAPEEYPVSQCLRTGQTQPPTTIAVRGGDGNFSWMIFTAVPLNDPETGLQSGAVVTFVDITEQTRAEEKLHEAERRFRLVVETVKAVVWVADPETFQFTYVNQEAEKVLGFPAQQWMEETNFWANHLHPDDRAWAMGFCMAATRDRRDHEFEYRMIAADGRVVWLHDLVSFATRPDGTTQMVGVLVDVTESKRAATALRESEERFRQIAENLEDVLWMADFRVPRVVYINPAYERTWGLSCQSLYERFESFIEVVLPEDRPIIEQMVHDQTRGKFGAVEYRIRRPDGTVRWIRDRSFPIRDAQGGVHRVAGIAEDVTQRKGAEEEIRQLNAELEQRIVLRTRELQEANAELEAFSYSVSHDLRSPLRAMQGFAQALVEDYAPKLDATARQYAESISRSAQHMDRLINDLFAYSRISRSQFVLSPVRLDLAVAEARHQVDEGVLASKAEVTVAGHLPNVLAHGTILPQAIANLLGNAVKFVRKGVRPRVKVLAEARGDFVRLWVEDNGIGIEPGHQTRLFNVFERLHTQEEYPGTGIGLAIVRRAMERMGGSFGLESKPGKGSRFWIELPASKEEPRP